MNPVAPIMLRVEYDSGTRLLKFFVGQESMPVGEWDLGKDAGKDPVELEASIGYAVLGALSAIAGTSLGNRNYLEERNNRTELILQSLRRRLESGERDAIVSMVLELVASARRKGDLGDLARAEELLRDAAQGGNPSAIEYLARRWDVEKREATIAISHGKS
ncbi:MAG: hypothetical protein ACXWF2_07140 [Usitatibacter sp.]